ncbi:hypothetical protein GE061_013421 [Apolygus lucorum]|uniref:Phosphatidylinositol transfer protein N-terminal domain-containing protein n=1 Tax=Apolygus lucorum TaxID=248454 RepID=A0A6A4K5V1_APOLU|nr:hypothetical protein GE061_013421 [Apolygus lucorum]
MLIKEYRIPLPLTVEEYQIGQLYSVAEASKNETGAGEGVEVLKNEPFHNVPLLGGKYSTGQYTYKIYHLKRKVPTLVKLMAPKGALELHEEAWNAYPFCRTVVTNPTYMKKDFTVIFDSLHVPDSGDSYNVMELPQQILDQREIVKIDIANDPIMPGDYQARYDPTKVVSNNKRLPLEGTNWQERMRPVMTCYKYLSIEFKWFGLQSRIEAYMHKMARRVLTLFHRQVTSTMDDWIGKTMRDIRELEAKTKEELDTQRKTGAFRGMADMNM